MCGIGSYVFINVQRNIVLFNRRKTSFNKFLQKYPLIYPIIVAVIISMIKFPFVFGQFIASWLSFEEALQQLFNNITWGAVNQRDDHQFEEVIKNWQTPYTSFYTNTFLYFITNLFLLAFATTTPVPGGVIVPLFTIGAGLGRFYGEVIAYFFPAGNYFVKSEKILY